MSRIPYLVLVLMIVLLSACGTNTSWEEDQVTPVSQRLLSDQVQAVWAVVDDPSGTANRKQIRLAIRKKEGGPVSQFDIHHEKLLHLMVISKDLSYFRHIHPEYRAMSLS